MKGIRILPIQIEINADISNLIEVNELKIM